ncbi:membrane-spanning 4-domains subfamily A member 4A-like [Hyperolius riggenbachi]|uniref:membrane-spanning 4-domains subfamily A member 4A-like n=1 Tax=Hyperolius riggenbachi TaxID=752182 RepID=UPI0035A3D5B4
MASTLYATKLGNAYETKDPNPPPAMVGNSMFFPPNSQAAPPNSQAAPPGYFASGAPPPFYNVSNIQSQRTMPSTDPQAANCLAFYNTFLKGKPKALGIVLIVFSVVQIALGIGSICTAGVASIYSGINFWGPIFYIIAGSLTIGAQARPNICLIKGSLGLNIVTAVFSFISLILDCVDLAIISSTYYYYYGDYNDYYGYSNYMAEIMTGGYAILIFLLLINLLLFCVSISLSVFGCRALAHEPISPRQVFIIRNDAVVTVPEPMPYAIS